MRQDIIYSVSVTPRGGTIDIGREEPVLTIERLLNFDLSPDGKTMIVTQQGVGITSGRLNVILNWFEEVNRVGVR